MSENKIYNYTNNKLSSNTKDYNNIQNYRLTKPFSIK